MKVTIIYLSEKSFEEEMCEQEQEKFYKKIKNSLKVGGMYGQHKQQTIKIKKA